MPSMVFRVSVEEAGDGEWVAHCGEPSAYARGLSPANALDKLRDEIRYRLEYCPCSGVDDDFVELEIT
jgi:hypothetical protein